MRTAGVGGPITGKGAHLLIVDDPTKSAAEALSERLREHNWQWWERDASTRLEPGGCAVLIATRWHEDDLPGRLIRGSATGEGPPVRRLHLPALAEGIDDPLGRQPGDALWPWRYSKSKLETIRDTGSHSRWLSLYQQNPSEHEGTEWPPEYFDDALIWSGDWPAASEFHMTCMAIDPSKGKIGGDFGAIVFAGVARGLMWVEAVVERLPIEKLVGAAIDMALPRNPMVVTCEGNGFQDLAMGLEFNRQYELRQIAPLPLRMIESRKNKEDRIRRLGTYFQQKRVRFRSTAGCKRLVQQLREFPLSEHDDGPDALEMVTATFQWMQQRKQDQGQAFTAQDYTET
jgi:predicted phage terminase large subunit-like protein